MFTEPPFWVSVVSFARSETLLPLPGKAANTGDKIEVEKSAAPRTDSALDGEEVPIPTLPLL